MIDTKKQIDLIKNHPENPDLDVRSYLGIKAVRAYIDPNPKPTEGCDADIGYVVIYPDGYTSWCPKEAFEEAHVEIKI